jgi:hypothetical protein
MTEHSDSSRHVCDSKDDMGEPRDEYMSTHKQSGKGCHCAKANPIDGDDKAQRGH